MDKINKIISVLKRKYKTKFFKDRHDPFQILVSCLLSTRTKDEVSLPASNRLFKIAKTPAEVLKLNTKVIEKAIYPVGFYKTKARTIKELCKKLIKEFNSKVPEEFEELNQLPGIGRKCANITLSFAFNKDVIAVDSHVYIISNRLGWANTKTPEQTEKRLMQIVPKKYWKAINNFLVLFGQDICISVSPFCSKCPINKYCPRIGVKHSR